MWPRCSLPLARIPYPPSPHHYSPHRCPSSQGDIENVAQMQPRDLTSLFEHVSGSAQYRQQVPLLLFVCTAPAVCVLCVELGLR